MTRNPRKISQTGVYHIVFRGVNHCHLFEGHEDFEKMLEILSKVKDEFSLKVYAFCLLDNHVHLLLKESSPGDISLVMKKVLSPYAFWFNRKYQRSGALIANRYRSECVEDDEYLLVLVRYIHQNPLLAGITRKIGSYRWSSYAAYSRAHPSLADTAFVLGMFSDNKDSARSEIIAFHNNLEDKDFSLSDRTAKSDEQARQEMVAFLRDLPPNAVCGLPREERNHVLASLRKQGYPIRQIERITGVSRKVISKAR